MSAIDRLQGRAHRTCTPLNVTMEITLLCNLRCVHCYNFDRQEPYLPMRSTREELSDEEIHRIIDEVRAEGCLFLAFTGGEALVHPGLVSFVEHARSLGTYVRLKSNGVLLTDAKAKELVHAGVSAVDISLYGAEAATHDAFVMRPGAFVATIEGAKASRDAGMKTKFNITVTEANAGEFEAMSAMAAEMDIPWDVNSEITDRYDGTRFPQRMRPERATLEGLLEVRSGIRRSPRRPANPSSAAVPDRSPASRRSVTSTRASARHCSPGVSASRRSTKCGRRRRFSTGPRAHAAGLRGMPGLRAPDVLPAVLGSRVHELGQLHRA